MIMMMAGPDLSFEVRSHVGKKLMIQSFQLYLILFFCTSETQVSIRNMRVVSQRAKTNVHVVFRTVSDALRSISRSRLFEASGNASIRKESLA